jgi:hypothetical protein
VGLPDASLDGWVSVAVASVVVPSVVATPVVVPSVVLGV